VQLKIFNISKAYVDEIRTAGYQNITLDQLVQFKIFNIDQAFIKKATEFQGSKPTAEKLIQLKSVGGNN
jgi:hypothetical protein